MEDYMTEEMEFVINYAKGVRLAEAQVKYDPSIHIGIGSKEAFDDHAAGEVQEVILHEANRLENWLGESPSTTHK